MDGGEIADDVTRWGMSDGQGANRWIYCMALDSATMIEGRSMYHLDSHTQVESNPNLGVLDEYVAPFRCIGVELLSVVSTDNQELVE